MPSNLPIIRVRTSNEKIVKLKFIAKQHKKSMSKEVESLIDEHIEQFEKENGTIDLVLMSPKEIVEDIGDRITKKPPYGDNV